MREMNRKWVGGNERNEEKGRQGKGARDRPRKVTGDRHEKVTVQGGTE